MFHTAHSAFNSINLLFTQVFHTIGDVLQGMLPAIGTIIGNVVVILTPLLLRKGFVWLGTATKNETLKSINLIAEQVVLEIWNKTTKDLKLALADGHITQEEYAQILQLAKDTARQNIIARLPDKDIDKATQVAIDAAVEAIVAKIKLKAV